MTPLAWLFAGSAAAHLGERLLKRLTRMTDQYPEDVYIFLQPLNWDDFERDGAFNREEFDRNYGEDWLWSGRFAERQRRIALRTMIVLHREYLGRMDHNVAFVELAAANDWRVTGACRKNQAADSQRCLESVAAMEEAATELEREADLPENHAQAEGLRRNAAQIRLGSKDLLREDSERKEGRAMHDQGIIETRGASRRFREAAEWQAEVLATLGEIPIWLVEE
ncbi:MAG TPA: hypothetical protein VNW97_09205 [Candidatus Saccharimonadales bacterium]|jgi:hypothetical protein|nr:hypothetical protein [Candidatus Saccharimonadales bacterium]